MKQRVFIIDSPSENKFSKFTQNIENFPSNFPNAQNETKSPAEVADFLNDLALCTIRPSQISGQFMFTISPPPERKYTVALCSLGVFAALIRLPAFFLQAAYYTLYNDKVIERFGIEYGANSTLGVTELILSLTIFISDFVGSFLFWKGRHSILNFLNRLRDTVLLFVDDMKDSAWIHEWFQQTTKKTRRLVRVINIASIISSIIMSQKDIYKIFQYLQGNPNVEIDLFGLSFPIFAAAWFYIFFHRLHFRLWLMSIIDILQFGFQVVKEHVLLFARESVQENDRFENFTRNKLYLGDDDEDGKISSTESSKSQAEDSVKEHLRELKLTQILEKYRIMEQLLEEYNELFAPHLLIGIVSNVVVMLMALFHFFVEVNYKLNGTSGIFAIEAVVYTLVLFSMGTAATDMASEADACITALRDVPLGSINACLKQRIILHFQHAMALPLVVSPGYFFSLNRKMLTSVAGTLTTYLIVLIQFQTSEKPGAIGTPNLTEAINS